MGNCTLALWRSTHLSFSPHRGPMYVHYNRTLRNRTKGSYVTTLHAINSGIIKLSKQTKACTVYRGVAGGVLPEQFWEPNEHGVMGGIELGFVCLSAGRTRTGVSSHVRTRVRTDVDLNRARGGADVHAAERQGGQDGL